VIPPSPVYIDRWATQPHCGDTLRALTTISYWKLYERTRLIVVSNGNKVRDWEIRKTKPKSVIVRIWFGLQRLHGCGCERFN
jgi:hypothetical protein